MVGEGESEMAGEPLTLTDALGLGVITTGSPKQVRADCTTLFKYWVCSPFGSTSSMLKPSTYTQPLSVRCDKLAGVP